MKKLIFIALIACRVIGLQAQSDTTKYGVVVPRGFSYQLDVVYKTVGDWQGRFDIYMPPSSGKPTPLVINIHGGSWARQDKSRQRSFGAFFNENIAVANINYRLLKVSPAPAAVEDVRSMIVYMINHAGQYNIDPNNIILRGSSAGGHLAMLAGYLADNPLYDADRQGVQTIGVSAIVNVYGVADMSIFSAGDAAYPAVSDWLGNKANEAGFVQSVSPVFHINKNSPPTFTIHGDADPLVPFGQSILLTEKLQAAGVANELFVIPGGKHGGFTKKQNNEASVAMIAFLKRVGVLK